jgi:hypothetical protein
VPPVRECIEIVARERFEKSSGRPSRNSSLRYKSSALNTLLYLSYGRGPHELEVQFSALSAVRNSKRPEEFRTLVYTDNPDSFANQPVDVRFVTAEQWVAWAGPQRFNHRRKIVALQHALADVNDRVVLLDGDTWLRGPTNELFDRISPGRSLLHLLEGRVSEVRTTIYQRLKTVLDNSNLTDINGVTLRIPAHVSMWNAGVIGLHPADAPLLAEVLHLTDQLTQISDLHVLEQFAFSYVLSQRTSLSEAADLVFHYWPPYLHHPFREKLPLLMKSVEHLPLREKIERLYSHRPRPGLLRRTKVVAKRILQYAGIIQGQCRTNEW